MKERQYNLGVLFVHGMGTQKAGQTLAQWGDALIACISRNWTLSVTVQRAGARRPTVRKEMEAILTLREKDQSERWLLAEAWWAEAFQSPTYRELLSWSVRALPWAVAAHIAQRYWWVTTSREGRAARLGRIIASVQLIVVLFISPLLIGLLGIGALLGLVPKFRPFVLGIQSTLTASVGDCLAFVESPIRAAYIRTRIGDQLKRMVHSCQRTVVIAHSEGAAVV